MCSRNMTVSKTEAPELGSQDFEPKHSRGHSARVKHSGAWPSVSKAMRLMALLGTVSLSGLMTSTSHLTVQAKSSPAFTLSGIGYREQELQVAKGSVFSSEAPTGVYHASFAGNTNIFIKGDGFTENA